MKIFDIVKTIGSAIIKNAVPGGGLIIDTVNALLPDGLGGLRMIDKAMGKTK